MDKTILIQNGSKLYTAVYCILAFLWEIHSNTQITAWIQKNIQFYVTLAYKATHLLPKKYVKLIVLKLH